MRVKQVYFKERERQWLHPAGRNEGEEGAGMHEIFLPVFFSLQTEFAGNVFHFKT